MVSTDEDVVKRFHALIGAGFINYELRRRSHRKDLWKWNVTDRAGFARVAELLGPHLGARRRRRLAEVLAATSAIRRPSPRRPKCNQGHVLAAPNRKPNGRTATGRAKFACRICINQRSRARYRARREATAA
jgi:hypothetical protein